MSQIYTQKKTSSWALKSRAFGEGFRDAKAGKPFNYDKYIDHPDDHWNYERGRLFALVYDGDIKKNRRLTQKAQWAFTLAIRDGTVI